MKTRLRAFAAIVTAAGALAMASCGSAEPGTTSSDRPAAVAAGSSPAAFPLKCVTQPPSDKRLPPAARATVRRFIHAVAAGKPREARGWLAPDSAGDILAGLAPVERLGLLAVQDRY
jgi:hypothetical protein